MPYSVSEIDEKFMFSSNTIFVPFYVPSDSFTFYTTHFLSIFSQ